MRESNESHVGKKIVESNKKTIQDKQNYNGRTRYNCRAFLTSWSNGKFKEKTVTPKSNFSTPADQLGSLLTNNWRGGAASQTEDSSNAEKEKSNVDNYYEESSSSNENSSDYD